MARRMICHGAVSRCITSDSANGSSCGVCSEGTLRAALDRSDLRIGENPQEAGKPAVEGVQRFAGLQDRADRQQVLDHIGRTDPRQGTLLVAAGDRSRDLVDRIRRGELKLAHRHFELGRGSIFPYPGQREASNSRA